MANYSTLKAAVADVVKTNGEQAITGANLQTVLLSIINSIGGGGYIFEGVATPSTDAGTPDQNVFYIGGAGTYANFGTSVVVPPTNIAVFKYNGSWTCEQVTVENGGVFDISAFKAVGGTLATYADLASALGTGGANVPESVRKGGMSIKYVRSSDNKYVQCRYMGTEITGSPNPFLNTTNWQGVDDEPTDGSDNLVKSGGIANAIQKLSLVNNGGYNTSVGIGNIVSETYTASNGWACVYIDVFPGDIIKVCGKGGITFRLWATLDKDRKIVRCADENVSSLNSPLNITVAEGECYVVCNVSTAVQYSGYYIERHKLQDTISKTIKSVRENAEEEKTKYQTFNLNTDIEDIVYTTSTARNAVPSNIRKKGLIITYKIADYDWRMEQYVGTNPNSQYWVNDSNWREILNNTDKLNVTPWEDGNVYSNKTVGQTIASNTNNSYARTMLRVSNGDIIEVSGISMLDNYRVWATTDEKGVIKRVAELDADNFIKAEITITEGESFIYCNTKVTEKARSYVKQKYVSKTISNVFDKVTNSENNRSIFNVNVEVEDTVYTKADARNAVPLSMRKKGLIITYKITGNLFRTEEYQGTNPTNVSTWAADSNWIVLNNQYKGGIITLAAYNSSERYKASADMYSDTEGGDIKLINNAINLLNVYSGGGKILLSPGTYSGTNILNISNNNIVIEGAERNSVIIDSSNANYDVTIGNDVTRTVLRNIKTGVVSDANSVAVYEDCIIGNVVKDTVNSVFSAVFAASDSSEEDKAKANIVLSGTNDQLKINEVISNLTNGGTLYFMKGTYHVNTFNVSGTLGYINVDRDNLHFLGAEGKAKFIRDLRPDGYGVFNISSGVSNLSFRNIDTANNIFNFTDNIDFLNTEFDNVTVQGKQLYTSIDHESNINIGQNYAIKTLRHLFVLFNNNLLTYPDSNHRYNIHIWGDITNTVALDAKYDYVNYIGHDATITCIGNDTISIKFKNGDHTDDVINTVRDITFRKIGCYNYYSNSVVYVNARNYKFENCVFENLSCSPTPFDPSTDLSGVHNVNGDRRHGIDVYIMEANGEACKTSFHNCIGKGSPYGFKNTRGWYFTFGSPKVYNSEGYGGGIGIYGHGIVCHRGSSPVFHNFHGYGSNRGYADCAGIRPQAAGQATFIGCIGQAGCGERWKSEGVPYATLHSKCVALGITDESFFYDGETVNYAGLTEANDSYKTQRNALLASLTYDDVVFTKMNENTAGGGGFHFWANGGCAKLIDCIGYAGSGDGSAGMIIERDAVPDIVGGYFGYNEHSFSILFEPDEGEDYMTFDFDPFNLNSHADFTIIKLMASINGISGSNRKMYIETVEATPKKIVNGYTGWTDAIITVPLNVADVPAGVQLKMYFTDMSDNIVSISSATFIPHFFWCYANDMFGIKFIENSSPTINGAIITANKTGVGIMVETADTDYLVKDCVVKTLNSVAIDKAVSVGDLNIFDSLLKGSVDAGITFKAKTAVNNSSNYRV